MMTQSDRTRLYRSGAASAGLWLVLFILVLVVPVAKHEQNVRLPAVKIVLRETAVPSQSASRAVVRAEPARSTEASPAKEAASVPKTAEKKSAKSRPAAERKSDASDGLGIPNFSTPLTSARKSSDDAESLEFTNADRRTVPGSATSGRSTSRTAEFEGSAAKLDSRGDSGIQAKSADAGRKGSSSSALADTSQSLGEIAGSARQAGSSDVAPGTASQQCSHAGGASSDGPDSPSSSSAISGLSFDGTPRKALTPLVIHLPDRLAKLIDSNRTVTVRFTVLADGSVPASLIEITPQAVLPPELRDWLRKEFSSWRFEKGSEDGQALFRYSITLK